MGVFILTMAIIAGAHDSCTTIVAEYQTYKTCKAALDTNRLALSSGTVILATCTPK